MRSIFQLYKRVGCDIPKIEILRCLPVILQHISKYTYLAGDLQQYLPIITSMVNDEMRVDEYNAQKQLMHTVYQFTCNVCKRRLLNLS